MSKFLLGLLAAVCITATAAVGPSLVAKYGLIDGIGRVPISRVLCRSAVAVSAPVDTSDDVLASCTIPAGAMGSNGAIRFTAQYTYTNNANAKNLHVYFGGQGGTTYFGLGPTTTSRIGIMQTIHNRGSASSQISGYTDVNGNVGASGNAPVTSAIATSAATTIVFACQKAVAGDTCTLEAYLVELLGDGT